MNIFLRPSSFQLRAYLLLAFLWSTCPAFAQTTRGLYTDSTGNNIGIGTTTPQTAFAVTNGNMGIGTWTADGGRLIVSGGNVGIGTTLPSQALAISGNLGFTNGPRVNDSSGKLQFQAGGTGTGSTGTGSIYFLDSSAAVKGRIGMAAVTFTATGGTITTSGSNEIHTFTSNGTFTVTGSGTVSYLVVAGGGGGSGGSNGGGGAGGMRTGTLAVTAQAYSITVGAGGAGGSSTSSGSSGNNSVFSTITSTGGGGGGGANLPAPTGGSGGGGGNNSSGGAGTGGQGNNGGTGPTNTGGGGGGAGAVGANGTASAGGNGGAGTASSISGSSVTYAGGGGAGGWTGQGITAGSGGSGGGGAGSADPPTKGSNGTANTGGGGGGGGQVNGGATPSGGGDGGSGIVIISFVPVTSTYGTLYIGATNTSSADLAEYYVAADDSLEAGDVVCLSNIKVKDANGKDISNQGVLSKCSTANDPHLIGIISTNPGVILGSIDSVTGNKDKRLLALSGKVPTKVSIENGPISIGDHLTSSSTPGVAMKQTQSGQSIGIALQGSSAKTDKISVFVDLGYQKYRHRDDGAGGTKDGKPRPQGQKR